MTIGPAQHEQPNVAVLRIPLAEWDKLAPQQQLLMLMQQLLTFMASEYFPSMDGLQIQASDVNNIAGSKTIVQVGQAPQTGLIKIN